MSPGKMIFAVLELTVALTVSFKLISFNTFFDCATSSNTFNCTNNFFRPLFVYSSYNYYGATICIKAVYSRNAHC